MVVVHLNVLNMLSILIDPEHEIQIVGCRSVLISYNIFMIGQIPLESSLPNAHVKSMINSPF